MKSIDKEKNKISWEDVKFWENFRVFSKYLTIKTIIITFIILFFNWSRFFIWRVDSINLAFAKSISFTNNSYTPNPNINNTIPIKNKSIEEIILKRNWLLLSISDLNIGLSIKIASTISQLAIAISEKDDKIERTTVRITIYLENQSPFSKIFFIIYLQM